jgi:hypothetical protein
MDGWMGDGGGEVGSGGMDLGEGMISGVAFRLGGTV